MVDQQDAVPGGYAEDREESDQRPQRHDSTAEEGRDDPAHQGERQGQEDQQGGAPAAERCLQQEKISATGDRSRRESIRWADSRSCHSPRISA